MNQAAENNEKLMLLVTWKWNHHQHEKLPHSTSWNFYSFSLIRLGNVRKWFFSSSFSLLLLSILYSFPFHHTYVCKLYFYELLNRYTYSFYSVLVKMMNLKNLSYSFNEMLRALKSHLIVNSLQCWQMCGIIPLKSD